jgi:Family of unknown function (DUF6011)
MSTLQALHAALPLLSSKNADFARSLLLQDEKGRKLSEKQQYWVEKLVAEATAPKAEPVAPVVVGDVSGIIALFNQAGAKLKFPKIRLALENGAPVVLSRSGQASKAPGSINVTDGGPFGSNVWYGRVSTGGEFKAGKSASASVVALLTALAADPAGVAGAHGKITGSCVFCAKKLSDKRSLEVGYGETCATNYGLAWGEVA